MRTLYWIDDVSNPQDTKWNKWIEDRFGKDVTIEWCHDYFEFEHLINMGWIPDIVCFDHDLGGEKSGYDCCVHLINYCMGMGIDIPEYAIQSSNPVGESNIRGLMNNYHQHWYKNKWKEMD